MSGMVVSTDWRTAGAISEMGSSSQHFGNIPNICIYIGKYSQYNNTHRFASLFPPTCLSSQDLYKGKFYLGETGQEQLFLTFVTNLLLKLKGLFIVLLAQDDKCLHLAKCPTSRAAINNNSDIPSMTED